MTQGRAISHQIIHHCGDRYPSIICIVSPKNFNEILLDLTLFFLYTNVEQNAINNF